MSLGGFISGQGTECTSLEVNNTKIPQKLANPSTPLAPPGYYCWKCWFERNSENRVNRMCRLSITDLLFANL